MRTTRNGFRTSLTVPDLNYVLSEMQSELTVQHAYIDGGDFNLPPRVRVALPGARFDSIRRPTATRSAKIFDGQNEEDIYRSPLTEVGSTRMSATTCSRSTARK